MAPNETNGKLLELLKDAKYQLKYAPINIVGTSIVAIGGDGGGSVTGMKLNFVGGYGNSSNTGFKTTITGAEANVISAERGRLSSEIDDAIEDLEAGRPKKSMLKRIAERLMALGLGVAGNVLADQITQVIDGLPS